MPKEKSLARLRFEIKESQKRLKNLRTHEHAKLQKRNTLMLKEYLNGKSFSFVAKRNGLSVATSIIIVNKQFDKVVAENKLNIPSYTKIGSVGMRKYREQLMGVLY